MNSDVKIIAIVPAYNEQDSIVSTIGDLKNNASNVDYVIVNDGSKDKTVKVCKEHNYNLLSLPINLGLSGAFQTGMKYALENDYDYAVQFDADGQHSAAYISAMLESAQKLNSDIVVGSRFCSQKKPVSARMIGSQLITTMIRLTTGKRIQDPTSGMRLFNKRMIRCFAKHNDLEPEPDTLSFLMRSGASVSEVQVEMRERIAGESYLNFTKSITYMLQMAFSILFVQWFRKKIKL
ncbi:glycosyltransferase family 2 protein [Adlercreutzia sp. ZJ154]|uniref:glycosyltransferase family 2 protein n=1 Tax=Adlercreutzia sp. ZJ154 TaxID=2709790 RepID=UPI0013EA6A16|nr:glycosyltransferase family 2 protein [Adlercreutzia sp. ZJ154]